VSLRRQPWCNRGKASKHVFIQTCVNFGLRVCVYSPIDRLLLLMMLQNQTQRLPLRARARCCVGTNSQSSHKP
jgi:hypothetical protein